MVVGYSGPENDDSDDETKPNKKYYDPRMALRAGEESMAKRLGEAMEDLNCTLFAQPAAAHTRTCTHAHACGTCCVRYALC